MLVFLKADCWLYMVLYLFGQCSLAYYFVINILNIYVFKARTHCDGLGFFVRHFQCLSVLFDAHREWIFCDLAFSDPSSPSIIDLSVEAEWAVLADQ